MLIVNTSCLREDINSLPGVSRWGVESVLGFLRPVVEDGLASVLLFGVPTNIEKVFNNVCQLHSFLHGWKKPGNLGAGLPAARPEIS